jgi:large subunit ribosomal protein L10
MRAEKQIITSEYAARLNASPFFLVVEYRGLAVKHFNELRRRLAKVGAEIHVVKNSIFRIAVKGIGMADLEGLTGQLAVVTGRQDVSVTAKVLKTFQAEFDRPKVQFGFLKQQRLEASEVMVLADLPPLEVMRGRILGAIQAPATRLAQVLNAPAQQLVRVLQGRIEKAEKAEKGGREGQ